MRFFSPTASPRSGQRHHRSGLPRPTACASRFSRPPDALIRPEPAGLISCQIRSWGSALQSLAPPVQPYAVSGASYPLVVAALTVRRPTDPPPTAETVNRGQHRGGALSTPRLQGLAPHESPPLVAGGLDRRERVALLGFLPPGCSPPPERLGFHRTSPHELGSIERERSKAPALQGLDSDGIGLSLSRLPTLLGFHAS